MSAPAKLKDVRALDPVRARLIERARADADAFLDAARAEAAGTIAAAEARAEATLDEARIRGEVLAAGDAAEQLAAAHRDARVLELAAQRAVYDEARDGIDRGIRALRDAPDYPNILAALERRARDLLGSEALFTEDECGGVIATVPGRRLDLSLPTIATRVADSLGEEVARLWTT